MNIERHSRMRQIELGRILAQRRKVYLDACFWIILRDAELGIRTGAAERKLLHFLRRGVQAGRIVCPISAGMFMELMKQPFTRRIATARLIDELSLGVSIIPEHIVLGTEISAFLLTAKGDVSIHPLQELVWTKVSYALGDISLAKPAVGRRGVGVQRRFFDHLWDQSLATIIDLIGDAPVTGDNFRAFSQDTNVRNQVYRDELKSYEGTYDIELRGAIEIAGDVAADIIADLAATAAGRPLIPTPQERAESVKMCRNLLYRVMKKPEHRAALRTLHVGASLHAGMRWNKERKFKPNDYYDFHHATTALNYCDYFFTDGALHFLVTRPQLNLESVNGCKVMSDPAEAAEAIRIAARSS